MCFMLVVEKIRTMASLEKTVHDIILTSKRGCLELRMVCTTSIFLNGEFR